jgi:hypothetical protein
VRRNEATQKTLAQFRKYGWEIDSTERWIPFVRKREEPTAKKGPPGHRKDLYGFIDLIAMHPDHVGLVGINACTYGAVGVHVQKIQGNTGEKEEGKLMRRRALIWIGLGNRILIYGWRKPDVARQPWPCRVVEIVSTHGEFLKAEERNRDEARHTIRSGREAAV